MEAMSRRAFVGLAAGVAASAAVGRRASGETPPAMTDAAPAVASATDLAARLRAKRLSSVELTRYYIERIERYDEALNAVVVRDFERALAAAADADAALARGEVLGPLHGLPMTIKESYDVAGLPTTWGFPAWRTNRPTRDAAVVRSLRAAGAHVLGKTNVPLFLADFQSYNEIYGTTNNPWDVSRTPGGSSGGSAAALAAGLTPLESGSDIGGSIRNPAHFCGVYGHKPTWGIVPIAGHAPPGVVSRPDLAVVGPLARSADDLSLSLTLTAGAEALDAPGWRLDLPAPRAARLADLRVSVWSTHEKAPVDDAVQGRVTALAEVLRRAGATVSESARPAISPDESFFTYWNLLSAVTESGVPDDVFERNLERAAQFGAGDQSPAAIHARSAVQYHRTWLRHNEARTRLRMAWQRFFEDWDLVVCPIMPTPAFPHDHSPNEGRVISVNGAPRPYFEQIAWAGLSTVAGLPSTVFPAGRAPDGLPVGLQAVGPEFGDHTTIEFARLLTETGFGGFTPPPGFDA